MSESATFCFVFFCWLLSLCPRIISSPIRFGLLIEKSEGSITNFRNPGPLDID
ncbi:uncharacterized protein ASPGLDRAFT_45020 [Aspergillus glaucus CBS 516.65]|uniref:Uncharacterized protein n=1 Tax=Aspergillus glaucus CBS 516.65 TaxID=1160497 RepID=A0A1L9VQ16_ASPGL|nr:hypothetical protein ASPGLDRAFT_45020 [Aspergillus glaucus CBS 516.65]OJJ86018.1 hypothetical protein ASPGLDRAFT_45020 [Aspergillus glaucus CBS 516.65]